MNLPPINSYKGETGIMLGGRSTPPPRLEISLVPGKLLRKIIGVPVPDLKKSLVLLWNSSCPAKQIRLGAIDIKDRQEVPRQFSDCRGAKGRVRGRISGCEGLGKVN